MDLEFGPYRLKRQERTLFGPGGAIELSSRSFDILGALLDKPGELIGKAELFDAVWPGVVVEENTLQVHMSALRKALGPNLIATVHGRGYKYVGPEPQPLAAPASAHQSERKPVIVVLPFENLSGDPEQQYFSDGIIGDITDRLTRFRGLSVIGQHSAAALGAQAPKFVAIRERLKADYIVTGSVRRTGERVRIATRLTEAMSEESVWAERYDRPLSDLFTLQDEISELVAAALARQLEIEIYVRSTAKPAGSLSSYEQLLKGCWHFKSLTRVGSRAAHECFERALALDPRNAAALSWLGMVYCEAWVEDFSIANAIKGAELTGRAIALDPSNAKGHAIHAWALLCNSDRVGALQASARGAALNPGDPAVLINQALALTYEGRHDEARGLFAQANRLEPFPPLWFAEFASVAAFAIGRYEDCLAGFEAIPEAGWDMMYALASYGQMGLKDEARDVFSRMKRLGINLDFEMGISHEPFRDPGVTERLREGVNRALGWQDG
jgi:pentatricopeptide repeat protein